MSKASSIVYVSHFFLHLPLADGDGANQQSLPTHDGRMLHEAADTQEVTTGLVVRGGESTTAVLG